MNDLIIRTIDADDLDEWRAEGTFQPGYYRVKERACVMFAYSPDGIGCIWYNTAEDMRNGVAAE